MDKDLIYLGLLTLNWIKPLSRMERDLTEKEELFLQKLGLKIRRITRIALNGNKVIHAVFSLSERILDLYIRMFDNLTLLKTPDMIWLEGIFFGFPECCIQSFIDTNEGHPKNGLTPENQAILFHWVCPNCQITPQLIPLYRQVWEKVEEIYSDYQ